MNGNGYNNNYHQKNGMKYNMNYPINNKNNDTEKNEKNEINDSNQIICTFHLDFIPDSSDLYKYFQGFGKITNKLEVEYEN